MKREYKVLLLAQRGETPPLGLGCLKAYADAALAGLVSVEIKTLPDLRRPEGALAGRPDLVGVTCCGDLAPALAACAGVRAAAKRTKIVLGGPATYAVRPEELFGGGADFVVRGEGELTFAGLLRGLCAGRPAPAGIKGLSFRSGGRIVNNSDRPECRDLAALPSPYLSGALDLRGCSKFFVEGSRGCRFRCRYCAESRSALRWFPEERVLAEVRHVLATVPGAAGIAPADADFFADKARALRLLDGFSKLAAGRRAGFVLTSDPARWDKAIMRALAGERFRASAGVQSLTPRALAQAGRPGKAAAIKRNIRDFVRLAPAARLSLDLIEGLPGDTLAGYKATLDWALATGASLELNPLMVLPRTEFGLDKKRFGLVCGGAYPYPALSSASLPPAAAADARALTGELAPLAGLLAEERPVAALLRLLGRELRGAAPRPYLLAFLSAVRYLRRSPRWSGLAAEWAGAGRGAYFSAANAGRRARLLLDLGRSGRRLLKGFGRSGTKTAAYAAELAAGLAFSGAAGGRAAAAAEVFGPAGARPPLLLACSAGDPLAGLLRPEAAVLAADPLADETYAWREASLGAPVPPAAAAGRLRGLAAGKKFGAVILSGFCSGPLLRAARRAAAPGAGLLLFLRRGQGRPSGAEFAAAGWARSRAGMAAPGWRAFSFEAAAARPSRSI